MKKIILLLLLITSNGAFSQELTLPPPELEATPQNKKLIIELMLESKFEEYFTDYCSKRIEYLGEEKGLTKEKITEYKKKINFHEFLDYTVFNQFASLSSEELQQMITLFKMLNKSKKYNNFILSTAGLESNLELKISQYMED